MARRPIVSNQSMEFLRAEEKRSIHSSILGRGLVTASHIKIDHFDHGYIAPPEIEHAFQVAFQLREAGANFWVDGKNIDFKACPKGYFTFFDYRRCWEAELHMPFECVNFHFPLSLFKTLREDVGNKDVEIFKILPGDHVDDPIVRGIVNALLPAFHSPQCVSRLFVDQLSIALAIHLGTVYGDAAPRTAIHAGGLASWQLDRATAIMDVHLGGDLPLTELGEACGLSPAYFARAFKVTTGIPPYRWLLRRRIDKAMDLLRNSNVNLGDIAERCGFADQSHFNRVFSKSVGIPPGEWRKLLRAS